MKEELRKLISERTKEAMKKLDMKRIIREKRNTKGSRNSRWKGGCSLLRSLLAFRVLKELKPRILQRDGYRCRYCGGEAKIIHHLKSLAKIKDEVVKSHSELSLISDVGLLSDLIMKTHTDEVVVSVCENCHKNIHYISKQIRSNSVNGRTPNTEPSLDIVREGVESRRATSVGKQNEGVLQSGQGCSI